jgi:uncharacterized membrane protein
VKPGVMERLVCALFDDEPRAAKAIDALVNGGVSDKVVSVVLHEGEVTHEDLGLAGEQSGRRMVQGAAIGTTIGALIGGLLAGPAGVLVGGPIAAVLVGGASGGLYGTLAGAITGRDDEQPVIKELATALESGKVLVTLDIEGPAAVRDEAKQILARAGGKHIAVS